MTINRRTMLRGLLGGAFAAWAGPVAFASLARGAPREDQCFVFCYFAGGWDVLLGLDPRDPSVFTDERIADTRIQPGYDRLRGIPDAGLVRAGAHTFGPYIGGLARHADRLAVVRGMSMDTLAHDVGRRRFLTGRPPSGLLARGSSASAHLAYQIGRGDAIPNLSSRVEQYNPELPVDVTALSITNVKDLVRMLRPGEPALPGDLDALVTEFHASEARCAESRRSTSRRRADGARLNAKALVDRGLDDVFDFDAPTRENDALRARFGIVGTGAAANASTEAQAAMAARALTSGITHVVSFEAATGLDTHFSNWESNQGPNQQRGFDAVARLADYLAETEYKGTGSSWLDHTTIIGFSEFSRTPLINATSGRDHHLTNSCFLLGGLARGGASVGASSDVGMTPQNVSLDSGQVDRDGEVVRPEHVLRGLMVAAGIEDDVADLRVQPVRAAFRI